jgi:ribosomal protein S18 acetylase RimI-like enzyme
MSYAIAWHHGERRPLRGLFELADDSPEQLDRYIDLGRVLIAVTPAAEIVGHVQLVPTGRAGVVELKSLAVRDEHRRRGVGRALVDQALAVCRVEGARVVTLRTAAADVDNLRFYQRCGFRLTSVEPDAFTPARGYPPGTCIDGIPLRDAVWLGVTLD